jgi:hypothetical protein
MSVGCAVTNVSVVVAGAALFVSVDVAVCAMAGPAKSVVTPSAIRTFFIYFSSIDARLAKLNVGIKQGFQSSQRSGCRKKSDLKSTVEHSGGRPVEPLQKGDAKMATENRETSGLIGSDKVEGTAVYGTDDEKIGWIERIMIGKRDGKVSYAVLSFGGFLGFGDEHYPLPWDRLIYDTSLGGYRVNLTKDKLEGAPKYSGTDWDWEDRNRAREINDYYGSSWTAF